MADYIPDPDSDYNDFVQVFSTFVDEQTPGSVTPAMGQDQNAVVTRMAPPIQRSRALKFRFVNGWVESKLNRNEPSAATLSSAPDFIPLLLLGHYIART